MRRNARGRRSDHSRRAGMIDAARRWKARAEAGCAQAPGSETTSWSSLINSTTWQSRFNRGGRRSCSDRPKRPSPFAEMEESQRIGFETVVSLTQLSASRRPTMRQMVAERSGMLNSSREVAVWNTTIVVRRKVGIRESRRPKRSDDPGNSWTRLSLKGRMDWMARKSR